MCSVPIEKAKKLQICPKSTSSLITFGVQLLDLLGDVLVGPRFRSAARHVEMRGRLAGCWERLRNVALHHRVQAEPLVVGRRATAWGAWLIGRLLLRSFFEVENSLLGRVTFLDVVWHLQLLMVGANFWAASWWRWKSCVKKMLYHSWYNNLHF